MTAIACELMWKNLLHPSINCSQWDQEEDRMLMKLAEASSGRLWDSIAAELGSGRTGFQCFHRYQAKHSYARDKRKWTSAEDNRLKQLVERLRINNYVPWSKV